MGRIEDRKENAFVFVPSILVTQPIFNYLSSEKFNTFELFSGCYGSGKTVSFVLFHTLLAIINQYVFVLKKDSE